MHTLLFHNLVAFKLTWSHVPISTHMWWFHQDYAVNSWYTGIVLRLSPYGAFVAVKSGSGWAEGLVKTNQIQGDDLEVAAEVWMKNGDGFCHVFGKDMVEKDEI